jgi:hypothetical protein
MSTQTESTKTEGLCPWVAPGEGDLRSPCPALNSLANHGYMYVLPLTSEMSPYTI